jgi:hypothetical protein
MRAIIGLVASFLFQGGKAAQFADIATRIDIDCGCGLACGGFDDAG